MVVVIIIIDISRLVISLISIKFPYMNYFIFVSMTSMHLSVYMSGPYARTQTCSWLKEKIGGRGGGKIAFIWISNIPTII